MNYKIILGMICGTSFLSTAAMQEEISPANMHEDNLVALQKVTQGVTMLAELPLEQLAELPEMLATRVVEKQQKQIKINQLIQGVPIWSNQDLDFFQKKVSELLANEFKAVLSKSDTKSDLILQHLRDKKLLVIKSGNLVKCPSIDAFLLRVVGNKRAIQETFDLVPSTVSLSPQLSIDEASRKAIVQKCYDDVYKKTVKMKIVETFSGWCACYGL